ncbi:family 43 glycosylhydrolase [Gorillibacterium sp. CAU 1737]|uniref:family 43 glycosylhydrolase n=1 Tax=Gorillibacterium sp. CAU 1737 TaxID=3140362 RepID=UPI003260A863
MKITAIQEIHIQRAAGEPLQLPSRVQAEAEGGVRGWLSVNWEPISPMLLNRSGTIVVEGTVVADEYPNPLIPNRADPFVMKHTDGYYYFTGSVPEYDRLVLRRSRTIAGLADAAETVLWTKHEEGEMGSHIWAPELHRINGKWYLYFAAGSAEDKWAIRPYVLECAEEDPISGAWVEKGEIKLPNESFSLDATTFEHEGQRYLIWAQIIGVSSLFMAKMSTPWSIEGEPVKLSTPEYEWEIRGHHVNEGPAVLKRNGRIFLAYSASATDDRYCMGLLTASDKSDLLDPASWTKSKEPVFVSHEQTSEFGPGHNSFTVSEDGVADVLVYHSRSYREIAGEPLYDPNRHARVQPLWWNADGTPYFGQPGWKPLAGSGDLQAIARITTRC